MQSDGWMKLITQGQLHYCLLYFQLHRGLAKMEQTNKNKKILDFAHITEDDLQLDGPSEEKILLLFIAI